MNSTCEGKKVTESTTAVRGFHNYHYSPCNNKAVVERQVTEGYGDKAVTVTKSFCKVHDPQAKQEREMAREAKRVAENNARFERESRERRRRHALEALGRELSVEGLELIAKEYPKALLDALQSLQG